MSMRSVIHINYKNVLQYTSQKRFRPIKWHEMWMATGPCPPWNCQSGQWLCHLWRARKQMKMTCNFGIAVCIRIVRGKPTINQPWLYWLLFAVPSTTNVLHCIRNLTYDYARLSDKWKRRVIYPDIHHFQCMKDFLINFACSLARRSAFAHPSNFKTCIYSQAVRINVWMWR